MKTLLAFVSLACCAIGASAREVSLNLTGSNGGLVRRASFATASAASASADSRVVREHRLAAGSASVTGLAVDDRLIFQLFDDKELTVVLTRELPALEGKSFLGKVEGDNGFDTVVVLETANGLVLDVTDMINHRVWQVTSNASGVTVRELTPEDHPAGSCGSEAYAKARQVSAVSYSGDGYPISSSDMPNEYTDPTSAVKGSQDAVVRVLVCFDEAAQSYATSKGYTSQTFAQKSVNKMNAALANTGLLDKFRFELAGVMNIPANTKGKIETLIYYIDGEKTGKYCNYDWKQVRAQRAAVKADIATVLSHNSQDAGTVGIGDSLYPESGDCGYNACLIKFVDQDHTMTHECGHNMGAGHDLYQGSNSGPQYASYSSGHYFDATVTMQDGSTQTVKCHTIMAYDADENDVSHPCEAPCFSSPNYKFFGVTVGTAAKNDNSRTIAETYKLVAQNHVTAASTAAQKASDIRSARWTTSSDHPCTYIDDADDYVADDPDDEEDDEDCLALEDESWIEAEINNAHEDADDLDFFYAADPDAGTLQVISDDTVLTNIVADASNEWQEVTMPLPQGKHTLKFLYEGDEDSFCFLDEITVADDVTFPDEVVATNSIVRMSVPYDWIDRYYPGDTYISYEDRARKFGENGHRVWESYLAGLDPTNETSKFEVQISMTNGLPKIEWNPKLSDAEASVRKYIVYGKPSLTNDWTNLGENPSADDLRINHFFKVGIEAR